MYVYKIHDILYWVVSMKLLFNILVVFLITGCQTIENKTDEIGKREIQEVSKFLQKNISELKIEMGQPDEIIHDEKGSKFYIYKKKNTVLLAKKNLK